MAINLAKKYSPKVDERFKLGSLAEAFTNQNYEFKGVDTVAVYAIDTVALSDYEKSGTSRYGTPNDLGDAVQEMKITQDKAFTFIIDRGDNEDQMNVKEAGRALRRQTDEVVVPARDKYIFDVMAAKAVENNATDATVPTKTNAYELFLKGQEFLTEKKVPLKGRKAAISPSYYTKIKLDPSFIKNSDKGQKIVINGQVGEIDGVPVVVVPAAFLPAGVEFIIAHPMATVAPKKIEEYKIHTKPQGISGQLVEGRFKHDTFVLDSKKDAIYAHKTV